jgi:hypothetical protein
MKLTIRPLTRDYALRSEGDQGMTFGWSSAMKGRKPASQPRVDIATVAQGILGESILSGDHP